MIHPFENLGTARHLSWHLPRMVYDSQDSVRFDEHLQMFSAWEPRLEQCPAFDAFVDLGLPWWPHVAPCGPCPLLLQLGQ